MLSVLIICLIDEIANLSHYYEGIDDAKKDHNSYASERKKSEINKKSIDSDEHTDIIREDLKSARKSSTFFQELQTQRKSLWAQSIDEITDLSDELIWVEEKERFQKRMAASECTKNVDLDSASGKMWTDVDLDVDLGESSNSSSRFNIPSANETTVKSARFRSSQQPKYSNAQGYSRTDQNIGEKSPTETGHVQGRCVTFAGEANEEHRQKTRFQEALTRRKSLIPGFKPAKRSSIIANQVTEIVQNKTLHEKLKRQQSSIEFAFAADAATDKNQNEQHQTSKTNSLSSIFYIKSFFRRNNSRSKGDSENDVVSAAEQTVDSNPESLPSESPSCGKFNDGGQHFEFLTIQYSVTFLIFSIYFYMLYVCHYF